MKKIKMRCPHKGCKMTDIISFDPTSMPKRTELILQPCPDHENYYAREDEARYFDKLGREI